jgi:hypothetical protein
VRQGGRKCRQGYRSNEDAVRLAVRESGAEEVRRLLRLHAEEAFARGLSEVFDQIPADLEVS